MPPGRPQPGPGRPPPPVARAAAPGRRLPARARPPRGRGTPSVIGSSARPATTGCCEAGTAATTRPAPARSAAREQSTIAPVMPRDPPIASTLPASYFEPNDCRAPQRRDGGRVRERGGRRHRDVRRDPDRHHDEAPVWARPGSTTWPIFARVERDRHVGGDCHRGTSPVDASTPLGRRPPPPARRRADRADRLATAPRGSPLRPVPSSASTTTSAPRSPSPTAPTANRHARGDRRLAGVERVALVRPRGDDEARRVDAELAQPAGGDQAVAAVGAAAADAHDPAVQTGTGRGRRARRPRRPPPSAACRARRP